MGIISGMTARVWPTYCSCFAVCLAGCECDTDGAGDGSTWDANTRLAVFEAVRDRAVSLGVFASWRGPECLPVDDLPVFGLGEMNDADRRLLDEFRLDVLHPF